MLGLAACDSGYRDLEKAVQTSSDLKTERALEHFAAAIKSGDLTPHDTARAYEQMARLELRRDRDAARKLSSLAHDIQLLTYIDGGCFSEMTWASPVKLRDPTVEQQSDARLSSDPDNTCLLLIHALASYLNSPERAKNELEKVVEQEQSWPIVAAAHHGLCLLHSSQREPELALTQCDKAIEVFSSEPKFYETRGIIYETTNDFDAATKDWLTANRLVNEQGVLNSNYVALAEHYRRIGQFDEAEKAYTQAIDWARKWLPLVTEFIVIRGNFRFEIGKIKRAIEDYTLAEAINQSVLDAHDARDRTYYDAMSVQELRKYATFYQQKRNDRDTAIRQRAELYRFIEDHEKAIKDHNSIIDVKAGKSEHIFYKESNLRGYESWAPRPKDLDYYERGLTHLHALNYQSAYEDIFRYARKNQNRFPEPEYFLARALEGLGSIEDARAGYAESLRLATEVMPYLPLQDTTVEDIEAALTRVSTN